MKIKLAYLVLRKYKLKKRHKTKQKKILNTFPFNSLSKCIKKN